jgi:hypothetical protein
MAKNLPVLAWGTRQAGKFPSIYLEQQFLSMPLQRFFQSSLLCSSQKYQNIKMAGVDGKKLACACLGEPQFLSMPLQRFFSRLCCVAHKNIKMAWRMAKILSALALGRRQAGKFLSIYWEQQFLSMPLQRFFQSSLLCSSQNYQNIKIAGRMAKSLPAFA